VVDFKEILEKKLLQSAKKKESSTKLSDVKAEQKYHIPFVKYTEIKPRELIYSRLDKFWKTEILPLRKTDSTVLIVSHAGIISVLRKYLMGLNYRFHGSLLKQTNDFWEVRNCSITEIVLGNKGPGEFIRMGDWEHILQYAISEYTEEKLENSTGEALSN